VSDYKNVNNKSEIYDKKTVDEYSPVGLLLPERSAGARDCKK
jgi:hypothetical protein